MNRANACKRRVTKRDPNEAPTRTPKLFRNPCPSFSTVQALRLFYRPCSFVSTTRLLELFRRPCPPSPNMGFLELFHRPCPSFSSTCVAAETLSQTMSLLFASTRAVPPAYVFTVLRSIKVENLEYVVVQFVIDFTKNSVQYYRLDTRRHF